MERGILRGAKTVGIVSLENDGKAISKLASEEKPIIHRHRDGTPARLNVKEGTYARRAVASYIVSKMLEFDIVPPTVLRGDADEQSLQRFIPGAKAGSEIWDEVFTSVQQSPARFSNIDDEFVKLTLFDYIIYNPDRHSANFLIEEIGDGNKKRLHAIDNDLAFAQTNVATYGLNKLNMFGKPIPEDMRAKIRAFCASAEKKVALENALSALLSPEEADACMRRIKRVGAWCEEKGTVPTKEQAAVWMTYH